MKFTICTREIDLGIEITEWAQWLKLKGIQFDVLILDRKIPADIYPYTHDFPDELDYAIELFIPQKMEVTYSREKVAMLKPATYSDFSMFDTTVKFVEYLRNFYEVYPSSNTTEFNYGFKSVQLRRFTQWYNSSPFIGQLSAQMYVRDDNGGTYPIVHKQMILLNEFLKGQSLRMFEYAFPPSTMLVEMVESRWNEIGEW